MRIAGINADPIKQLINTHWHFDHTGGNDWVHRAGATILAQENTRKHLLVATLRGRLEAYSFLARSVGSGSFDRLRGRVHRARESTPRWSLKHYLPAHTDSDISVHFTEADVFHTGDTFWNRNYPFIDYSTGGSIDGTIRAAEANIAKVTDKMIVDSRPRRRGRKGGFDSIPRRDE